jgi:hypothetical protein
MEIRYKSPATSTVSRHDNIYTVLLGVIALKTVFSIIQLGSLRSRSPFVANERVKLLWAIVVVGVWLLVVLAVLLIRIIFPAYRRWPTLGLNLIFLLLAPWGTALAIYGFWKVDKKTPIIPSGSTP